MGGLTQALAKAATEAGAEIRTNAKVARINIDDDKAIGVVLTNGEEIPSWTIVSNGDPGVTFLELSNADELPLTFRNNIHNYRAHGVVARVHLALSSLPRFIGLNCPDENCIEKLSGRIHIGPDIDYLERAFDAAKYGDFSPRPHLDITIPSLTDSSLAPKGAHVMSIHAQFAPFKLKDGDWNSRGEKLGDAVENVLTDYAPNLKESIVARQVITPFDLEQ